MDKELEIIFRKALEKHLEDTQQKFQKISGYYDVIDHIVLFKPEITEDKKLEIHSVITEQYESLMSFHKSVYKELSAYNAKDDYNDFIKCMYTQSLNTSIHNNLPEIFKRLEKKNTELQETIDDGDGSSHEVLTIFQEGMIIISNAAKSTVDDNMKRLEAGAQSAYEDKKMKDQIRKNCGPLEMVVHNSETNNNINLEKIKGVEIALK